MNCILNLKINVIDVLTFTISIVALIATLRKKEFGKLYFQELDQNNTDIWLKVLKSDLYDIRIIFEPYKNMSCRLKITNEHEEKDSLLAFPNESNPIVQVGLLKVNTILKLSGCNATKIQIQYKDKYNNLYEQELNQNNISERKHKNIWNLTFVGS
jgi:hypothetical protein